MPIGSQLAALRQRRGWTQAELARRLYVRQATISRWEAGRRACQNEEWLIRLLDLMLAEGEDTAGINDMQANEWVDPD